MGASCCSHSTHLTNQMEDLPAQKDNEERYLLPVNLKVVSESPDVLTQYNQNLQILQARFSTELAKSSTDERKPRRQRRKVVSTKFKPPTIPFLTDGEQSEYIESMVQLPGRFLMD